MLMKWKNWLSIACILGTLANPFKGNAQSFNGTLEGKIVDLSGTPINDTRIHVVDNSNPANFGTLFQIVKVIIKLK